MVEVVRRSSSLDNDLEFLKGRPLQKEIIDDAHEITIWFRRHRRQLAFLGLGILSILSLSR